MTDLLLSFTAPAAPLSMNEHASYGLRKREQAWRDRAHWAWIEAHPGVGPAGRRFADGANVYVSLTFPTKRRRDPINYAATVKRIVDGLVTAGAWPDDTPDHVAQHVPTIEHRPDDDLVLIRVSTLSPDRVGANWK